MSQGRAGNTAFCVSAHLDGDRVWRWNEIVEVSIRVAYLIARGDCEAFNENIRANGFFDGDFAIATHHFSL